MPLPHFLKRQIRFKNAIPIIAAGLVLGIWLTYTPFGILGKADAIGYAICHRISARSFFLDERQLPLCARCSGMYMGALIGLLFQARGGRRGGMPTRSISIVLGLFFLAFAFDGANSYLQLYPFLKPLYITENWIRLATGTGMGIAMASVLFPVFNQTVWQNWTETPLLHSWKQFGLMMLVSLLMILAILTNQPAFLLPVALLSPLTVLVLLGMIYTVIWVMLFKRENTFNHLSQMAGFLTAGFATALAQIGIMDLGRFILTGTWAGFFSG